MLLVRQVEPSRLDKLSWTHRVCLTVSLIIFDGIKGGCAETCRAAADSYNTGQATHSRTTQMAAHLNMSHTFSSSLLLEPVSSSGLL